jgi:hypothetical protein
VINEVLLRFDHEAWFAGEHVREISSEKGVFRDFQLSTNYHTDTGGGREEKEPYYGKRVANPWKLSVRMTPSLFCFPSESSLHGQIRLAGKHVRESSSEKGGVS